MSAAPAEIVSKEAEQSFAGQDAVFFQIANDLHAWFARHHSDRCELRVGYYKKGSGEASITWPESVDEALCVGWIDGVRRRLDERRYMIRFTPRKKRSIWSAVNIRRAEALIAEGRMLPAGLAAFAARQENRSRVYAYEQTQRRDTFDQAHENVFRMNPAAWKFFQSQRLSCRKQAVWWVLSAKQEATRLRRLEKLIVAAAQGRMV